MTLLNAYTIENLDKIKVKYRLFKVRGILPQSEDFEKNTQLLGDRLSRMTKSPCTIVKDGEQLFIAQPTESPDLPDRMPLVGQEAIIEKTGIEKELDYGCLNEDDIPLAIRFLQFYLGGLLHDIPSLWQPSAGMPYFQKDPDPDFRLLDVAMYRGFRLRLIPLPKNKIGICVDITRKYASRHYLPAKIMPDEFRRYKGRNCIYEFGHRWYEVSINGISGLNVSEERMPDGSSLFDYIYKKTRDPKPQVLRTLPKDCTVVTYKTKLGAVQRMPSALCRLTYATDHPVVSKYHPKTIMPPHKRRWEIGFVIQKYLTGLKFQDNPIELSANMEEIECDCLTPPDLEFGGGKILSLKNSNGSIHTTLEDFGSSKWSLLHSTDAGFFVKKPIDRQYLVMPKSMYETFGRKYEEDLKAQFRRLYAPNGEVQYDPMIITYDDSVRQSTYSLGNEIIQSVMQAVSGLFFYSGYGLVIIPRLDPRRKDKEDELANLLMRQFRKKGIFVSIAHTETPAMSYVPLPRSDGQSDWQTTNEENQARIFRGYKENVVLNKILLLNHCWPFVLSTPLNSDLIIGLDVKNNTVGIMLIFKDGRTFSFTTSDSDDKEKLGRGHASTLIYNYLKKELDRGPTKISDITIHRDGKLHSGEIRGIKDALDRLSKEEIIQKDYNCNFVEIKKTSRTPVRFFDTITPQGSMREETVNPKIGTYMIFQDTAFLCTTGRPFRYRGTTKPLQVTKVEGAMGFKLILEDVFALANLTWTKPNYCSRLPISIKMIDIHLREVAGGYSEDKLKFFEEEENE